MVTLFPFRWWKGHFTNSPQDYSFGDKELDNQDWASYATLGKYVEGFSVLRERRRQ